MSARPSRNPGPHVVEVVAEVPANPGRSFTTARASAAAAAEISTSAATRSTSEGTWQYTLRAAAIPGAARTATVRR
jgi:hypothetical protein